MLRALEVLLRPCVEHNHYHTMVRSQQHRFPGAASQKKHVSPSNPPSNCIKTIENHRHWSTIGIRLEPNQGQVENQQQENMHERRKLLHLPQQTTTKKLMALLLFTSSMASRFQSAQGFSRLSAFLGGPSSSFRRTYSSTPSSSLSMKLQTAIVGYVHLSEPCGLSLLTS
jgi:hypothetical protein